MAKEEEYLRYQQQQALFLYSFTLHTLIIINLNRYKGLATWNNYKEGGRSRGVLRISSDEHDPRIFFFLDRKICQVFFLCGLI